jgi:hypothetical protein
VGVEGVLVGHGGARRIWGRDAAASGNAEKQQLRVKVNWQGNAGRERNRQGNGWQGNAGKERG